MKNMKQKFFLFIDLLIAVISILSFFTCGVIASGIPLPEKYANLTPILVSFDFLELTIFASTISAISIQVSILTVEKHKADIFRLTGWMLSFLSAVEIADLINVETITIKNKIFLVLLYFFIIVKTSANNIKILKEYGPIDHEGK